MKKLLFIVVLILAYCSALNAQTYSVTVTNGYGSGVFHAGDTVHVWSTAYDTTQTFDYWSGDSSYLSGAHEWHTTLIMPAQNVNVTANIRSVPAYSIHYEQIMGKNNLKNVFYYFPASMKGVIYLFHGTGGQAANWVSKPEYRSFIDAAITDTFGFIITEAEEVTLGTDLNGDGKIRWQFTPLDSLANVDLANLKDITDTFINRGSMSHATNRYAMGMSAGGAFSTEVTYFYNYTAGISYCAPGSNTLFQHLNPPFAFRMALYDDNDEVGPAGNYQAWQNDSILQSRGICHNYRIHDRQPIYPQRFARVPGVSLTTSANIYNELVANGEIDANGYAVEDTLITANVFAHPSLYPALVTLPGMTQLGVSNEIAASNAEHMFYSDWNYASLQFLVHLCSSVPSGPVINGTASLCVGGTTSLSSATTGGSWSSALPGIATVGTAGLVSGVAPGTATINYATTSGTASIIVTVTSAPVAGAITGTTTVCTGATAALTDAAGSGVWSSAATGIATVNSSGVVTGVAMGTTSISYAVTNSCGTAATGTIVTVNATSAGTVSGASAVGVGLNVTLTDAVSGGTWSASNSNATVSGGIVTGVSAGTVIISYSVSGGCGIAVVTKGMMVATPTVAAISGYYFYLCSGTIATFWDVTPGGAWSVSPANVASVSPTGIVTGIGAGTATLSYTLGAASATTIVTVYAAPAAITGPGSVCAGATTALSDATGGGTWSSSIPAIATISGAGIVSGTYPGTTTIYYTTAATGCRASLVVTVASTPSGIGGPTSVCAGASITLSNFIAGGTWSSTGPASVVASGTASALVSGVTAGTATITYSMGSGCYRTYNVTVKALPTPILGNQAVCGIGAVTFLSDATAGISWTIAPVAVATVSPSGRVYGASLGTANVTYTGSNLCITTVVVTVNAAVTIAAISGANNVSHGATITLSDATTGGNWSSSNSAMATVDPGGLVTGVGTSGTVIISYRVDYPSSSGCAATATKSIAVHTPAPHIHGGTVTTTVGATVNLNEAIGGEWIISDNTIATVDANGMIVALAVGTVTVTQAAGDVTTITQLIVNPFPFDVKLVPNPNRGTFTISGTVGSHKDEIVSIEIMNMLGQVVYKSSTVATGGVISEQVLLINSLANGMYVLNARSGDESKVLHFVVEK